MTLPVLVFDLETIPDIAGLRRLHGIAEDALSDDEVAELAFAERRAEKGNDFLPLYLQRIVTASTVFRTRDQFRVLSLASPELTEAEIIQRFFNAIEKFLPQLVSWNGGG
ncbi:MAG: 3'-5' exonuclease, partial [Zoogloeaceae bacterium]|nr:3'-5' exonuclease [Zoogloeaceae bacterium]